MNAGHHKEYFYRIFKGQKKYYIRTPDGHKKIAKSKIPEQFINEIELCDPNDRNWLKSRSIYVKKIKKTIGKLNNIENLNLSQKNYTKTKRFLEEDIILYRETIQYYESQHIAEMKRRYENETRKPDGFERAERDKRRRERAERDKRRRERINREKQRKEREERDKRRKDRKKNRGKNNSCTSYTVLTREGIIEDAGTPLKTAIKNYRRWMIKHHPDKGGNTQRCMQVNSEFEHLKNKN